MGGLIRCPPVCVLALVLAGCGGSGTFGDPPVDSGTAPAVTRAAATTRPAASSPPAGTPAASSAAAAGLPDLIGKGLQVAQDEAQEAGFGKLSSHDALGRGREQVLDRNWKVCFQTPAAGQTGTGREVDLGAVKTEEQCPAEDAGAGGVRQAGAVMPNLVGRSAQIAWDTLGQNASIDVVDGSGGERIVVVASNWKVCAQQPKAGAPYGGVPVTLTVVKFDEGC